MNSSVCAVDRIVVVAYACDPARGSEPGAGGRMFLAAARIAVDEGLECHVLTRPKHVRALREAVASLDADGSLEVHGVTPPSLMVRIFRDGTRLHSLAWQLSAYKHVRTRGLLGRRTIVHHVTYASDTLPSLVHLPKLSGARTIWGPVGSSDARLENPSNLFERTLSYLRKKWFRWLASRVSIVIGQTEQVTNRLAGIDTLAIVEQNCIVGDATSPEYGLVSNGLAKVAMLGVLNRRKRPGLALDALRLTGEGKWQLVVIGDGPLRESLERENGDLIAEGAVRFTGWLSQEEALRELISCRGVIHPSVREGAPWAIAEALSFGKWVVTVEGNGADALVGSCNGGTAIPNRREGMAEALGTAVVELVDSEVEPQVQNRWAGSRFDDLLRRWYFESLDGRVDDANPPVGGCQ